MKELFKKLSNSIQSFKEKRLLNQQQNPEANDAVESTDAAAESAAPATPDAAKTEQAKTQAEGSTLESGFDFSKMETEKGEPEPAAEGFDFGAGEKITPEQATENLFAQSMAQLEKEGKADGITLVPSEMVIDPTVSAGITSIALSDIEVGGQQEPTHVASAEKPEGTASEPIALNLEDEE
jgi:hypothetical protein